MGNTQSPAPLSRTVGRLAKSGVAGVASIVLLLGPAPTAAAEPDTPLRYPAGSSATRASGLAFDTCAAPSLSSLRAWNRSSPYGTVNVYFGGINRACRQANLSASWVREATTMGWHLLPTYVGHQPSCVLGSKGRQFTESTAALRGSSDARDAISNASVLGLRPGSALYADLEHYDRRDSGCRTAVRRYVSEWTKTLHNAGYLSGVYVHQNSGLRDLSDTYDSSSYARPDAIWMARWDGNRSLTGWPTAPNGHWANARIKQYRGDHDEEHGGVRINIDTNSIDAPVATVAQSFGVTARTGLNARSEPSTSGDVERTYASGASVSVVCQTMGEKIGPTSVWSRLSNGMWVTDYYLSTPASTRFANGIPECAYPGQVTASALIARAGPGVTHAKKGSSLPRGALAHVVCQTSGSLVEGSRVWNKLDDGRWVSDYYVANRSNTGFSSPVPRCPS